MMKPRMQIILYLLLLLTQVFVVYIIQHLHCQYVWQKEIEIRIDLFKNLFFVMVLWLPLFYFLQSFYNRNYNILFWILVNILYFIVNCVILGIDYMIVNILVELSKYPIDCDQGKIIYITELIIGAAWQILIALIYLQQNGALNTTISLFRVTIRLVLILTSTICVLYSYYIMNLEYKRLNMNEFESYSKQNYESYKLLLFYVSIITALIYLLIIQLSEVYNGNQFQNKNKFLNFFILYTFIICLSLTFSSILYAKFIVLYLIIQLNSYQELKLEQVQINQNIAYSNIVLCSQCDKYITLDDKIIYLEVQLVVKQFHQDCYPIWNQNNPNQDIIYFADLSSKSQTWYEQSKYIFYTLYLLNLICIYFFIKDNQENYSINLWSQIIINCLSALLHKKKGSRINCFLQILVFVLYCLNLATIFSFYMNNQQIFLQCHLKNTVNCFLEQFKKKFYLFIYNIILTAIQAYQMSYYIIIERIQNGLLKVILFVFILMNFQSFVFFVKQVLFPDMDQSTGLSAIDGLFIMFYLLNIAFLIFYLLKKVNSLEEYQMKITKLFQIKVVVLAIILIISLLNSEYPIMSETTFQELFYKIILSDQVIQDNIVKFAYLITNIQFIFYLIYLYSIEAKTKLSNQQINLMNMGPLIGIGQFCQRCRQLFQAGQVIIYNKNCTHFTHKNCIRIKWINYQWCCQDSGNEVIEIIKN